MRVIFDPEEMKGRTLYGRQCNAHKTLAVKPPIDETRREAVLGIDFVTFILLIVQEWCCSLCVRKTKGT